MSKEFPIIKGAEPFYLKGNGPSVLVIHGFTASPTEVRPVADYVNNDVMNCDVHSVLLSGHGTDPEDLRSKKWQDWWLSVKNKFNDNNGFDYVVGLSTGGLLASRLAVENPERVKGLVLLSTPMNIATKFRYIIPILKNFVPYISKSKETEEYFKTHNLVSYNKYPLEATTQLLKLIKFTKKNIIPKLNLPTLIVQGEKDETVSLNSYKVIKRIMEENTVKSNIKLELFPKSGHIITVEPEKDQLLKKIIDFINSIEKESVE